MPLFLECYCFQIRNIKEVSVLFLESEEMTLYYHQQTSNRNSPSEKKKKHVIRVIGEGKADAVPNRAEITIGVKTEDKQLEAAQKKNAVIISKITNELNKLGISNDQIQTVNYVVFPQYDFVEGKQVFRDYAVEHLLRININEINKIGLVVDKAVEAGANIISGINFTTSEYEQFEQQALAIAVINAYQKAEAIARTLNVHLIKEPILVAENIVGAVPLQTAAFVKSEATPIQPGTLEISRQVTADFIFQK